MSDSFSLKPAVNLKHLMLRKARNTIKSIRDTSEIFIRHLFPGSFSVPRMVAFAIIVVVNTYFFLSVFRGVP